MSITRNRIERNLKFIRKNIEIACAKSRREPEEVSILAVSKSVDEPTIRSLLDAGLTELGENRTPQLVERAGWMRSYLARRRNDLAAPVRWHMIGHLQRNKVKQIIDDVDVIHSVDSLRLAEEISARADRAGRTIDVMVQVNCSQEDQKSGVAVGAAVALAEMVASLKRLRLVGMMTMAAASEDPEDARLPFQRLREIFEEARGEKIGGEHFRHLSMGMSNDYMVAIEEGATIVRIGSALFA